MRRGEVFWGVLLVLLGGLFFLKAAGYLAGDVFGWFWPICVILAGVWILLGGSRSRAAGRSMQTFTVPLQGAREASLQINHGVGRMELRAGASTDQFLKGTSALAMNLNSKLAGQRLEVAIDAGPSVFPFIGPEDGVWTYMLNQGIPTTLSIHAGASHLEVDLSELQVTHFSFDGGASSLSLTLPARVQNALVELKAGATSMQLKVPEGLAVRFRTKSVGSLRVDEGRFPQREPGLYQSADYESATHRADISVDGGATSIQLT